MFENYLFSIAYLDNIRQGVKSQLIFQMLKPTLFEIKLRQKIV